METPSQKQETIQMNLVSGIKYNLRGLGMGFKTPKLLMLGLIRFFTVILITILSSGIAVIFLAWDNTDLTPARQLVPFKERFRSLRGSLLFHLGFGILFLIPVLNILFLSFAPVGATLYQIDKNKN
jgi:CysZ protein